MKLLYTGTLAEYNLNNKVSIHLDGTTDAISVPANGLYTFVIDIYSPESGVIYTAVPFYTALTSAFEYGNFYANVLYENMVGSSNVLRMILRNVPVEISGASEYLYIILTSDKGEEHLKNVQIKVFETSGLDSNNRVDIGKWKGDTPEDLTAANLLQVDAIKTNGNTPIVVSDITSDIDDNSTQLADIRTQTDKLDDMIEVDSSVGYKFTAEALEDVPSGGLSETELHDALDSYVATAGDIKTIKDKTDTIPTNPASAGDEGDTLATLSEKIDGIASGAVNNIENSGKTIVRK